MTDADDIARDSGDHSGDDTRDGWHVITSGNDAEALRRSIAAVEALLQHIDDGPARPGQQPEERSDRQAALVDMPFDVLAHLPPDGTPHRADVLRDLLAAHDEANRLRAEAAGARAEAAARGRQLITEAQERAARVLGEARADADAVRSAAARELAAARDDTESSARAVLTQAAAAAERLRRAARAEAARIEEKAAAWLAEQEETAAILGQRCREEARVEATQIRRRAREEGRRRAAAERDTAVAAAIAGVLADTGDLLVRTGQALTVVRDRIERTAREATRFDTGAGLALGGLREAQQALTALLPSQSAPSAQSADEAQPAAVTAGA